MLTEANSNIVREAALETDIVVCGGGNARIFAFDAL